MVKMHHGVMKSLYFKPGCITIPPLINVHCWVRRAETTALVLKENVNRQLKYILMFYSYLERVVAVSLYTLF